ncbi:hypothetical protein [Actinomadura oligospora]|uniref:hypothetical protein n=1 Tax=Actinomadura oligospora TaxID=111804 RepID=UPI0004BCABEB|nr:hypothetical protein [Actinomadura oligospora]
MAGMVVLGIVLVAAIVLVAVGASREKRADEDERLRALRDWAAEHRWNFAEGDLRVPWRGQVGRDGFRVRELLTGDVGGLPVSLGHGTYPTRRVVTDANGDKRTETMTNHLTVLVVRMDGGRPDMEVKPRGVGSRLMRAFGHGTAVESGDGRFDARFQVESDAPETARDYLSSDLIRAHLDDDLPLWSLRQGELMVVRHTALHPCDLDEHLGTVRRLAELLGHRF